MPYAPIIFVSAKTGQRIDNIYERINYVHNQANTRISTGMLNEVLGEAQMRVQPPTDKGKRLKIYYMTQISVAPPTFVIFCNSEELFHFSYRMYIENCEYKADHLHIGQKDNSNYCRCASCTALYEQYGAQSAPIILFTNALADEIGAEIQFVSAS